MENDSKRGNASLAYRVFLRFLRVFVAGGLGSMATVTMVGYSWSDFRAWIVALLAAFISGGLAALDKGLRG